ncbi:unnamed protein product [Coregonus sp. 'balchen']|nr:unnamed protein product [Coregonus sp. 'balchen']
MEEAEERISTAEDKLEVMGTELQKLRKNNEYLMKKVDHLENYSRMIGLREGCEGTDPIDFSAAIIPSLLGKEHLAKPLVIERAHRSLAPRQSPDQNPQPFLVRFLRYQELS